MPETWRGPTNDVPICPDCQRDLSFIGSWTFRGLWGYTEVRTYECSIHGPIFVRPETSTDYGSDKVSDAPPRDNGDRDSLIPAPRKPTPTLNTDTIAVPEPDSD
jgi:hypothetical protein